MRSCRSHRHDGTGGCPFGLARYGLFQLDFSVLFPRLLAPLPPPVRRYVFGKTLASILMPYEEVAMASYTFADDEHIVLKAQKVRLEEGKTFSIPRESELMLTNRNVVFPLKGITGRVKSYAVYPLTDIRIVDGKPQCRLDTSDVMDVKLELLLKGGVVTFIFDGIEGKREIREWINAIYQLVVGHDAPTDALGKSKVGEFFDQESIADSFGRVFASFENARQRKRAEAAGEVAVRCPSCDASLKGKPGETVACPYCGGYVTIS